MFARATPRLNVTGPTGDRTATQVDSLATRQTRERTASSVSLIGHFVPPSYEFYPSFGCIERESHEWEQGVDEFLRN